jgi:hypothetical protein
LVQSPLLARLELRRHALVHAGGDDVEALRRHNFDGGKSSQLLEARVMAEPRRFIDFDHSTCSRSLEHRIPTVDDLSQTNRMVADFMSRAREMLAGGVNDERLNAIGRLLSEVSREPGFIPQAEMKSLHGSDTTSAVLQSDPTV